MPQIEMKLDLKPTSAWHVGTGYGLAGVVDARTARTGDGTVYLPGSSVKGRVQLRFREVIAALGVESCPPGHPCRGPNDVCAVCNVFGSIRQAGGVFFPDLQLVPRQRELATRENGRYRPLFEHERRTNVMISRPRGVAFERRLFTTEAGTPELCLTGDLTGNLESCGRMLTVEGESVPQDFGALVAAIGMVTHIGGRKSRGLGRCRLEAGNLRVDNKSLPVQSVLVAFLERGSA